MELKKDRGTVLRISFDIVYPDGDLKTVSIKASEFDDIGILAFSQKAIENFIIPNIANDMVSNDLTNPLKQFNTTDDLSGMKNAVLIMNSDGTIGFAMCGGHHG